MAVGLNVANKKSPSIVGSSHLISKIMGYLQVNRWTNNLVQNLAKALCIKTQSLTTNQIFNLISKKINRAIKRCDKIIICVQDNLNSKKWIKQNNLQKIVNQEYENYYPFIKTIFKLYFLYANKQTSIKSIFKDQGNPKAQMIMKMLRFQFKQEYLKLNNVKKKSQTLNYRQFVNIVNQSIQVSCIQVKSCKQRWPRNYRVSINNEQIICDYSFPKENIVAEIKTRFMNARKQNTVKFSVRKINRSVWSFHEAYPSYYLMGVFLTQKDRKGKHFLGEQLIV